MEVTAPDGGEGKAFEMKISSQALRLRLSDEFLLSVLGDVICVVL